MTYTKDYENVAKPARTILAGNQSVYSYTGSETIGTGETLGAAITVPVGYVFTLSKIIVSSSVSCIQHARFFKNSDIFGQVDFDVSDTQDFPQNADQLYVAGDVVEVYLTNNSAGDTLARISVFGTEEKVL